MLTTPAITRISWASRLYMHSDPGLTLRYGLNHGPHFAGPRSIQLLGPRPSPTVAYPTYRLLQQTETV